MYLNLKLRIWYGFINNLEIGYFLIDLLYGR